MISIIFSFSQVSTANNIQITNAKLTNQNNTEGYTQVQFDLQWENSWRLDLSPGISNWDAAWVFVKYRLPEIIGGDGVWKHAHLSDRGHNAGESMIVATGLLDPSRNYSSTNNPALGAFIYRASNGSGNINLNGLELRWKYTANGLLNPDLVEIEIFAIEMVFVPEGTFHLGSGGTEIASFTDGSWKVGPSTPLTIISEDELRIANEPGSLWDTINGNSFVGSDKTLPKSFPKGHQSFYIMKYSISQQQYVDFLNSLTPLQARNRAFTDNRFRNRISINQDLYRTVNPFVANNYISWPDGSAYLDWAGLRPMTELEYEKACRGTALPVPNEYAWGNTSSVAANNITNPGSSNETTATIGANAVFNNHPNVQGPMRVGVFATESSTREQAGASFWGVMELSGNLWERTVTTGEPSGRSYSGKHGDGLLSPSGNANVSSWPGMSNGEVSVANGSGFRGGAWITGSGLMRVSDRQGAVEPNATRENSYGFRGVRTFPLVTKSESTAGDVNARFKGGVGSGEDAFRTDVLNLNGNDLLIWEGGINGKTRDWFSEMNWSKKKVPLPDNPVLIPLTAFQPVISGSSPLNEVNRSSLLILKDSSTLTLDSASILTIDNQAIATTEGVSKLILEPGSLYVNLGSSDPTLELRQRIQGGKGWRLLGFPLKGVSYKQGLTGLVSQGMGGSDYPDLQPNVLWFDETDRGTTLQGWRRPTNVANPIVIGRGHYIYVFDGASIPGEGESGEYLDKLPITLRTSGKEHNFEKDGSFSFPLTFNRASISGFSQPNPGVPNYNEVNVADRGFNLIANPTASVIDFYQNEAWNKKNLDNSIYIWDPEYGSGAIKGGWRTFNGITGNLENGLLGPYQGFWVRTNDFEPVLEIISNQAKSLIPRSYFSRISQDQTKLTSEPLVIELAVQGEGMKAEAWVSFDHQGSPGHDPNDSFQLESLGNDWLLLYSYGSLRHKIPLQINNLDYPIEEEKSIPLMLAASISGKGFTGNYHLSWMIPKHFPDAFSIVLMDHLNEKAIDMRNAPGYDFGFKAPERPGARIDFSTQAMKLPGPVIFNSPYDSGEPTLRQTKSELNKRPFTIRISRKNTEEPIQYKPDLPRFLPPAPNPFQREVEINFYIPYRMNAQVTVYDMNGRIAKEFTLRKYEPGNQKVIWFEDTMKLASGVYLVQLIADNYVLNQKLIKN